MKRTITTLLLCHQFGQGLHAFITRISSELIGIIIDELIQIPRAIEFQQWNRELMCWEERCAKPTHAIDADEVAAIYRKAFIGQPETRMVQMDRDLFLHQEMKRNWNKRWFSVYGDEPAARLNTYKKARPYLNFILLILKLF